MDYCAVLNLRWIKTLRGEIYFSDWRLPAELFNYNDYFEQISFVQSIIPIKRKVLWHTIKKFEFSGVSVTILFFLT